MRDEVDRALARSGGVASRDLLVRSGVSRHVLDNEVRTGALVAVAPRTYCRPWDADELETRERAVQLSLGRASTLSHLTALRRWKLPTCAAFPIHATVPAGRCPRGNSDLVIHRTATFPPVVRIRGLVTVTAATAVTTSWPLLPVSERSGPAVAAVRHRVVTPAQLRASIAAQPRLCGRRALLQLVDLLEAGCESELDIWGHLSVFDVPGLRHAARQQVVRVRGVAFRLDLAYEEERVAVELDGRRFHSGDEQRERDIRRDAALASAGWLTLRYSHRRLHHDVAGCRADTLAALAARRNQRR